MFERLTEFIYFYFIRIQRTVILLCQITLAEDFIDTKRNKPSILVDQPTLKVWFTPDMTLSSMAEIPGVNELGG